MCTVLLLVLRYVSFRSPPLALDGTRRRMRVARACAEERKRAEDVACAGRSECAVCHCV